MATYNPHSGQKIDCCPDNTPTEMPTPVVRERWFICMGCDHFDAGQCDLVSEDLASYVRKIGARCPVTVSHWSQPKW